MNITTLEQLAIKHPYYCHPANYYSNEAATEWNTWKEFHEEFEDSDMDMNLVFRWDVIRLDAEEQEEFNNQSGYTMRVFIMGQRKGLFVPHLINEVQEEDVPGIISFLQPRLTRLKEIWSPLI